MGTKRVHPASSSWWMDPAGHSTAKDSPASTGPYSQAHSHLTRLLAAPREAEVAALPWSLPGELSDVQTAPVQSPIQTWRRRSHSCSRFLTAATFWEEFLQCFIIIRGKELEAL